jgi:hypothetical protein
VEPSMIGDTAVAHAPPVICAPRVTNLTMQATATAKQRIIGS